MQSSKCRMFLLSVLFAPGILLAQDTIWVKHGNCDKMYYENDSWFFKNILPDGFYCSYKDDGKTCVLTQATLKNGKQGVEYSRNKCGEISAKINWVSGQKEGEVVFYNPDGSSNYTITYKNGIANGRFTIHWPQTTQHCEGFIKNGLTDSIWTFYDSTQIVKQIKYINGREHLWNSWNENGEHVIVNGSGQINEYTNTLDTILTAYENGLKIRYINKANPDSYWFDSETPYVLFGDMPAKYVEREYIDGKVIKETLLYWNKGKKITSYLYPRPTTIRPVESWVNVLGEDLRCMENEYTDYPTFNGFTTLVFETGAVAYEGNYKDGKRYGHWAWYYPTGKKRMEIDYDKNTFAHYDSTGKYLNNKKVDYLTFLTSNTFYITTGLENKNLVLTTNPQFDVFTVDFYFDGYLGTRISISCGSGSMAPGFGHYYLCGDVLTLTFVEGTFVEGEGSCKSTTYMYKITNADNSTITLKKL